MEIKTLVLDLDGCLYPLSVERAADRASIMKVDEYIKAKGLSKKATWRFDRQKAAYERAGRISALIKYISREMNLSERLLAEYAHNIDPMEMGMRSDGRLAALFARLSKRYGVWIFTNAHPKWAIRALRTLGVIRYLDRESIIHMNNMGGYLKPDPRAFRLMLKMVGTEKDKILFIDNNRANTSVGRSMGIRSITANGNRKRGRNSTYYILRSILNDKAYGQRR